MRTSILFLASCLLVLSAGVLAGRLSVNIASPTPSPQAPPTKGPSTHPSWIADQLGLTPLQRQQMDAIWADTRQKIGKAYEQRRNFDKDRDKAIQDLLSEEQKTQYAKIMDDSHAHRQEFYKERERLIHEAEDRSRALLNEQQQARWATLHSPEHGLEHGPGPDRGHEMRGPERSGHGPEHGPATNTTTMPAQAGNERGR